MCCLLTQSVFIFCGLIRVIAPLIIFFSLCSFFSTIMKSSAEYRKKNAEKDKNAKKATEKNKNQKTKSEEVKTNEVVTPVLVDVVDEYIYSLLDLSTQLTEVQLQEDIVQIADLCKTDIIRARFSKLYENGLCLLLDVLKKYVENGRSSDELANQLHALNLQVLAKLKDLHNSHLDLDLLTDIESASKIIDLHL